jgi:hypothetical protein
MYREESLRACLQELERTGDFERLTQKYPEFAEQMQSWKGS